MQNKIYRILVSFLLICFISSSQNIYSKEIIVSPNGPIKSIKQAILLAEANDKIIVNSGIYAEGNIVINKKITLVGRGNPIVDGKGEGEIFTITADSVTISGLTIKNSGISYLEENAGIRLNEVSGCVINNNRFIKNFFAIYVAKSAHCKIYNNFISGEKKRETNSGNGIHLWYCKNITIENNEIQNHRDGIYFEFVRNGIIKKNISKNNLRYGLHFMFSDSCSYSNNTFENNGAGVAVMYTKNVLMEENIFRHNWGAASYGLLLKDISDSQILKNSFLENSTGVYIEGCSRIQFEKNDLISNGWALKLMANSMDNHFYENNFMGNSFDVSTNSQQSFNTFEKNYWSNYSGYDLDKDGFGDVPFRPVTMFSMMIESKPASVILLNSLFIKILDIAESILPALTPKTLIDPKPRMSLVN